MFFEKEHLMHLNNDDLQSLGRENAYNTMDVFEIMRSCSPGAALAPLKVSFQTTFEKTYLPAYKYIKSVLASDNPMADAYNLTEEILSYERIVTHDGSVKSDIREIRNLLEHDPFREGDHYVIVFPDKTRMSISVDDLLFLNIMTGLRSTYLSMFCNLFMVLRMYDLVQSNPNLIAKP